MRNRLDATDPKCSALEIEGREFKPILGGDYALTARFESNPKEKLYGMGQYQQPYLDLKGADLELAQRNSQASVPFVLSGLSYISVHPMQVILKRMLLLQEDTVALQLMKVIYPLHHTYCFRSFLMMQNLQNVNSAYSLVTH